MTISEVNVPFLDLKRRDFGEGAAIRAVLDAGRFIGGPAVHSFESSFAEYVGTPDCVAVANGTDALELALRAAGVQSGDEVATVANAGMYATTAIRSIGAVPVYVDIDPATFLISPAALEAATDRMTRALVVTHLYGRMAPMADIMSLANRRRHIIDSTAGVVKFRQLRLPPSRSALTPRKNLKYLIDARLTALLHHKPTLHRVDSGTNAAVLYRSH